MNKITELEIRVRVLENNSNDIETRISQIKKLINDKVAELYNSIHIQGLNKKIEDLEDENRKLRSEIVGQKK